MKEINVKSVGQINDLFLSFRKYNENEGNSKNSKETI